MRLFPRLLLSHLLVIALVVAGIFISAELFAPRFYRAHVEEMVHAMGPTGATLRGDLERGMRLTLTRALWAALPLAALVAMGTAYVSSRRVLRSVQVLRERSMALAKGEYHQRLEETGQDELADLAHNFNVLAAALESVEQGRVELIGNVAHELRAPLAALRGYADALTDEVMTPGHASQAIGREVGAMERLVRDLSLVSRVEAGQVELHPGVVDVNAVLDALRERFELAFEEKGVQLGCSTDQRMSVWADRERVMQVLTNVLGNALRHTPPGGEVQLDVDRHQELLRLTVTDTGPGIAPEQLPRIFDRFYRADPARARVDGGSGVGLTIARGLAEAMHGTLTARSAPGQGTAVTLTLPVGPA
ncbi:histidine kinase [Deinococcus metalli]|uniref:histidine kinase n=1 Tax=Deinococcus metalli TaxID=1141878 RepID=A0A7W8NTD5_9DEIO|nr:ATP-binding protein [Deinococcus metalli]MBB5379008.1 histidine kinase [Deinococcus metalli]GHF63394.1 two-component sensor histidine kinase [Deinococcus metalli]